MPEWLVLLGRLIGYLAPYRARVVLAYSAMLCVTLLTLIVPAVLAWVVDVALSDAPASAIGPPAWLPGSEAIQTWAIGTGSELLLWAAGGLLALAALRGVFSFVQLYVGVWLSQQVAFDLRGAYFDAVENQAFSFHDRTQTGDLMARAVGDISKAQAFVGEGLLEAINTPLLFLGTIAVLFSIAPPLAAVTAVPLLVLVWVTIRFGRIIEPRFKAVQDQEGVISTRAQENFTGARVVKAFAREPHEIERFDEENEIFLDRRIEVIAGFAEFFPTMTAIVTAAIAVVLWVGGGMVLRGEMTIGTLVGFNFWVLMLAQPTQNLGFLVNRGAEAIAAARRLFEILDAPRPIRPPTDPIALPTIEGRVRFDNVTFGYDTARPVLHDIDLTVGPNQVVALFGATGSGKTSLVSLIARFYDVTEGAVSVDDVDVRRLELPALRRRIGFVRQDAFLFSSSIRDNIAYGLAGRPSSASDGTGTNETAMPVDEELLVAAAKAAQAHAFITALPAGYDTLVGERGVTLSGGQRQRIAIARALVTRPRILVLDDALSAVDTETESRIQEALVEWMRGRTTFVIAQRLLSLQHADLVVVLDEGRIVERGSHDELVQAGGRYQRVYELQLQEQVEASDAARDSADDAPERADAARDGGGT